jgi:DNA-binding CsgD family transcriptional regulator
MRRVFARRPDPELSADDLVQAALRTADCRSVRAMRDALFREADALLGAVAMGLYLREGDGFRLVASRLAPQGFLQQYAKEYAKVDSMLECIVDERRTVDGFHFYGPAGWSHSSTYELLRGWGFYHNMGGAFVVNGQIEGVLFVATAHDNEPFEEGQIRRLDLLCRAGSLALSATRERERLRCELSNSPAADWREMADRDYPNLPIKLTNIRPLDQLPARSRAVAQLLCEGRPNKAIAQDLGISVHTVKEHVQNLCRRYGALNRTDLVQRLLTSY